MSAKKDACAHPVRATIALAIVGVLAYLVIVELDRKWREVETSIMISAGDTW